MTALNPEIKQEAPQAIIPVEAPVIESNITAKKNENIDPSAVETKENSDGEDPNWRAFREARKRDRSEREAAEKRAAEKEAEISALKAAMEAAFNKSAPTPQAYQQYYGVGQSYEAEESEDQKIERKLNALLEVREKRNYQEQMEREQREYPNRLAREFSDFAQVCSQENLDYLDYHFPELSRPLQRLPDGYDKWSDIYRAVKKFIPNHSSARQESARADINSLKPRSMSASAPSPTGQKGSETWQDTERRRADNWARMQRMLKGVG